MKIERITKEQFSVIGKVGSTLEGPGFIQKLWQEANSHFEEIASLAKRDEQGRITACYGIMSNLAMEFKPWEENYTKGLYLAGIECIEDATAPTGWTKWTVPGYEYLVFEMEGPDSFQQGIEYLKEHNLTLAGAVHDYNNFLESKNYMLFPIRKL